MTKTKTKMPLTATKSQMHITQKDFYKLMTLWQNVCYAKGWQDGAATVADTFGDMLEAYNKRGASQDAASCKRAELKMERWMAGQRARYNKRVAKQKRK